METDRSEKIMSVVYDILEVIQTQLAANAILADAVKRFSIFENEIDLVNETKKFSFVNLSCEGFKIEEADNMRFTDMKREIYPIAITFAVRSTTKEKAMKDIWTLHDQIIDAIDTDQTFSGSLDVIPFKPASAATAAKFQDERFWIGAGSMIFEGSNDINLR